MSVLKRNKESNVTANLWLWPSFSHQRKLNSENTATEGDATAAVTAATATAGDGGDDKSGGPTTWPVEAKLYSCFHIITYIIIIVCSS